MTEFAVIDLEDEAGDEPGLSLEQAVTSAMKRSGYTWAIRREGSAMRLFVNSWVKRSGSGFPVITSDNPNDNKARVDILKQVAAGKLPLSGALIIMPMSEYLREMAKA